MAKISKSVMVGAFFISLTLACASEPDPDSGYSQACEDNFGVRVDDDKCDDDSGGHYHHRYYPHGTSVPAVGSRMPPGGSMTRPSGSIGSFPSKGGFGGYGGTSGS